MGTTIGNAKESNMKDANMKDASTENDDLESANCEKRSKLTTKAIVMVAILIAIVSFQGTRLFKTWHEKSGANMRASAPIEEKYRKQGPFEPDSRTVDARGDSPGYTLYFPSLHSVAQGGPSRDSWSIPDAGWPLTIVCAGDALDSIRLHSLLMHLASWGMVVVLCDVSDPESANRTATFLREASREKSSGVLRDVDLDRVGILGLAEGGYGVCRAILDSEGTLNYLAAASLAPIAPRGVFERKDEQRATPERRIVELSMPDGVDESTVPILILGGDKNSVYPPVELDDVFDKIPADRVFASRVAADFNATIFENNGYATAWFLWKLNGDEAAAKAFAGEAPEIENNALYYDVKRTIM